MSKAGPVIGLNWGADAASEMRLALQTRLTEACRLGRTALDWADTRDVHNFRIALHRLRSALRDFKPYLRTERLAEGRRRLKTISKVLSKVRDQDVVMTLLEHHRLESPEELSAGIESLLAETDQHRSRMFDELMKAADRRVLAELENEFTLGLEEAIEQAKVKAKGTTPVSFGQAAHEIILLRLRKLQDLGQSLYQPLQTERIYRARIAAKRLRYALDLFAECRQGKHFEALAEQVAPFQSALGKLHDCDLVIRNLGHRLLPDEVADESAETDSRERAAAVWLLGRLVRSRAKHYCEALEIWRAWEDGGFWPKADFERQSSSERLDSTVGMSVALNHILDTHC